MGLGHGKMNKGIALLGVAVALLLSSEKIRAEDKEPLAIIALGGATEWGFPERKFSFGPSASVEFSAIKDFEESPPCARFVGAPGRLGQRTV